MQTCAGAKPASTWRTVVLGIAVFVVCVAMSWAMVTIVVPNLPPGWFGVCPAWGCGGPPTPSQGVNLPSGSVLLGG